MVHSVDHGLGCCYLGLPDGGRRFDIDNDRVIEINQIVGGIGEECQATMGTGPAGGWVGWRQVFWRNLRRGAKGSIVEDSEILINGPARHLGWKPLKSFHSFLAIGVGLDQAG